MRAFDGRRRSSDWQTLTLATGSGTARWRLMDGKVFVQVNIGSATIAPNTLVTIVAAGGIPAGYRPSIGLAGGGRCGTAATASISVGSDGSVSALHNAASTLNGFVGGLTYPVEG